MGSVTHVVYDKNELVKQVHRLYRLGIVLEDSPQGGFVVRHISESCLVVGLKSKQNLDSLLIELNETVHSTLNDSLSQGEDEVLRDQGRLCVPDVDGMSDLIM